LVWLLGIPVGGLAAAVLGVLGLLWASLPTLDGRVAVAGAAAPMEIVRDRWGVPHIQASSPTDAYFALGYAHAQDRLWQMELFRRAGQGRLAEILGEEALPADKMFRTLGLTRIARASAAAMDESTRSALDAYTAGVNAYLDTHRGSFPVEMDMLNLQPEPWSVEHSLLISRLMAWELNYARWIDILHGILADRLGVARARELYPDWPADAPVIVSPSEGRGRVTDLLPLLRQDQSYRRLTGLSSVHAGSNAWAVAGRRTASGCAILANDPHLMLTAPARWYELHVRSPGFHVYGLSIAGVPFVVVGRNERIAWGVTNAMLDDADYYREEVDSVSHPTVYKLDGAWRPVLRSTDTILVKNSLPVVLTTYATHRGPIINRLEAAAGFSASLLSMRWTGSETSQEPRAFYLINRAGSWPEFLEGLRYFNAPAQNFVYADIDGNIGYHMAGYTPLRNNRSGNLPLPGWTSRFDWSGFVPFDELPQIFNPAQGFVVTANNKIVGDQYPYYLSSYWEPEWRSRRITEALADSLPVRMEDTQRLQLDVFSTEARAIVPVILAAFPDASHESDDVKTALSYLRSWNYRLHAEDVAASVFEAFLVSATERTLRDELGEELMGLFDTLAMPPLRFMSAQLAKDSSIWFDDVTTPEPEGKNDVVRVALRDALEYLRKRLGGELKEWRWGRLHEAEFQHLFGTRGLLRSIFNVGPVGTGGSHATVNNGYFPFRRPFAHQVGASMRMVVDFSEPASILMVLPPGQSGHVYHRNYDDQLTLWTSGGYRRTSFDWDRVRTSGWDLLEVVPAP
jgi:penicillin amidase